MVEAAHNRAMELTASRRTTMLSRTSTLFTAAKRAFAVAIILSLGVFVLTGCDQSAETQNSVAELKTKFDVFLKLYADVGQRDYRANLYAVVDTDRQQVIAYIHSDRSIQVGETIFIGDDIWRVEGVRVVTQEYPVSPTPAPNAPKLHRPSSNELLVKFVGKARNATKDSATASEPEATP